MVIAATVIVALNALIHIYIMVLETALWKRAVKVFGVPKHLREEPMLKTMLKNQGAYNGVLALGLIWGLLHPAADIGLQIQLFFLGSIAAMGIVGAVTAKKEILFVQTIPAGLGIALLLIS